MAKKTKSKEKSIKSKIPNTMEKIAMALVIIGGLNWGLVGALNLDVVDLILNSVPILQQAVYILVGLSALYIAYKKFV